MRDLVLPIGEFAARFTIISMMITPLMMLFRGRTWPRWLMKHRRSPGVADFGCAALHTVLYLIGKGAVAVTGGESPRFDFWTGWQVFLIVVPLAVTATDGWVRTLGPRWKTLQRLVCAATVLTRLHRAARHDWARQGRRWCRTGFLPIIARAGWNRLRRAASACQPTR